MNVLRLKSCSPESNAKKSHRGPNHPRWIEDRSALKQRPRYEHREWSKEIFKRDNYTCQSCGKLGVKLEADHILPYWQLADECKWHLDNGRTLCIECHKKTDTWGNGSAAAKREWLKQGAISK